MGYRSKHGLNRGEWLACARLYAPCGERLPQSKANPELVRKIRENRQGWPRWRWAQATGLHIRTIDKIATYETWRHIR